MPKSLSSEIGDEIQPQKESSSFEVVEEEEVIKAGLKLIIQIRTAKSNTEPNYFVIWIEKKYTFGILQQLFE